jgi:hypothetical protein
MTTLSYIFYNPAEHTALCGTSTNLAQVQPMG